MDDARTVRHPIDARFEAFSFVSRARHRLHHRRHAQKHRAVQGTAIPVGADVIVKFMWKIATLGDAPGPSGESPMGGVFSE